MKVPRFSVLTGAARRAGRHGWVWLRDPDARREERAASSLVVFIMFFPLIVGAFGFGIDIARNIWIRTSIQNAVDSSAVGGAGVTRTDPRTGALAIDAGAAKNEMRKLYFLNRADNPSLTCRPAASFTVGGHTYARCWRGEVATVDANTNTAVFEVQEQSKNAFLGFLGQPTQNYSLQGKAKFSLATR
jgi:Putative Flp pilus-assembly TadE/G-like